MTRVSVPRIRRVCLKAGGEFEVLRRRSERGPVAMLRQAREISEYFGAGEMAGFVVLAWDGSGAYSLGYEIDSERSPFGVGSLPSVVSDWLRRDFIENGHWSAA